MADSQIAEQSESQAQIANLKTATKVYVNLAEPELAEKNSSRKCGRDRLIESRVYDCPDRCSPQKNLSRIKKPTNLSEN